MKFEKSYETENRIVFMGNSITEGWKILRPKFWETHAFINCGIGGQTTIQMLLRFRADVIELKPKAVVILAGINDIAQNDGFISIENIAGNIKSMAELANYHGINVVICSVLPAIGFPWNPGLKPANKIVELNRLLKEFATQKSFPYVDYYTPMRDDKGGLKVPEYTSADDLVHPNPAGYAVMEEVLINTVKGVFYKEK